MGEIVVRTRTGRKMNFDYEENEVRIIDGILLRVIDKKSRRTRLTVPIENIECVMYEW